MLLCRRRRKRVVDADGVHDQYNEGHQKKKKTTLIEGLGWVFAFMEIFAGCAFCFGSLLGVSFALACEACGKLLIYLLKLG